MTVRERRDGDCYLLAARDPLGVRKTRNIQLRVRGAFVLHPMDELNQLARALQVTEKVGALLCACGRVAVGISERDVRGIVGDLPRDLEPGWAARVAITLITIPAIALKSTKLPSR